MKSGAFELCCFTKKKSFPINNSLRLGTLFHFTLFSQWQDEQDVQQDGNVGKQGFSNVLIALCVGLLPKM